MAETGSTPAGRPWREEDVPGQGGRTAVITGANTGIGFEAARVLAERGALVVLACRDPGRADDALRRVKLAAKAEVATVQLNLASLASVRAAAEELRGTYQRIDILINNAGVMMTPHEHTEDGFELQFGTNHLGHFALTGLLLDRMRDVPGSRVVTVSSNGHRMGRMDFGNLQWQHGYNRISAYGRSKLANLLFAYELQRRLEAAGAATQSLAAHPGTSRTELTRHLPLWMAAGARLMPMQPAPMGAVPMLRAATDPRAHGGEYYGPAGFAENAGPATRVRSSGRSHDRAAARRLWAESERLTGVGYPL
jgi:NAD(P)-dependent dehydrogenase (short-subunit alcohol dehydrogenase family)